MSSSIDSRFLQLPRELRDAIYGHYVRVDDGYLYDFPGNKLREANGEGINLSLSLTCHQVAHDMRGIALKSNKITFKTHFSEEDQINAETWHSICGAIKSNKVALVNDLASRLLDPSTAATATSKYTEFRPLLESWMSHGAIRKLHYDQEKTWGEALSKWLDFVQYILDLLSEHAEFEMEAARFVEDFGPSRGMDYMVLARMNPRPWIIPTLDVLNELAERLKIEYIQPCYPEVKYSYSAAAQAIRFLETIHESNRTHLRHLMLLEDHESVSNPSSHARGLIQYCRQNRHLLVERILDLWTTGFPVGDQRLSYLSADSWLLPGESQDTDQLQAEYISEEICLWLSEALALQDYGMPEKSFKLTLNGNPVPEEAAEIFRVVERDAAFQSALDHCYDRGHLPSPSWVDRRLNRGYIGEQFPSVVSKLQSEEPGFTIRCNFPLSNAYDPESMIAQGEGWSTQEWERAWNLREQNTFQTKPPLQPWPLLRWGYVHPFFC